MSHKTVVGATALEHRGAFENCGKSSYWMDEPKTNAQTSKDGARNMVYKMSELLKFYLLYHGLNSEVLNVIGIKTNET